MTFTIEQTETAIRYAVAKRGRNFINNKEVDDLGTCQYLWPDETTGQMRPSCIVGVALDFLGVDHEALAEAEGNNARSAFSHLFQEEAISALQTAQRVQDFQEPWGYALAAFHGRLTLYGLEDEEY